MSGSRGAAAGAGGRQLKCFGKPSSGMLQPNELECFVYTLVEALTGLGEAELALQRHEMDGAKGRRAAQRIPSAEERKLTERVSFCREKVALYLEDLTAATSHHPVILDRVLTILAHHNFRIYSDRSVPDSTRQRLRELSAILDAARNTQRECKEAGGVVSVHALRTLLEPRVLLRDANGNLALPSSTRGMLLRDNDHGHSEDQDRIRLQDMAFSAILTRKSEQALGAHFARWRRFLWRRKAACASVAHALRAKRVRALAQAFGKWGRVATFLNAVSLVTRHKGLAMLGRDPLEDTAFMPPPPPLRTQTDWDGSKGNTRHIKIAPTVARKPGLARHRRPSATTKPNAAGRPLPWDRP